MVLLVVPILLVRLVVAGALYVLVMVLVVPNELQRLQRQGRGGRIGRRAGVRVKVNVGEGRG